MDAGIAFLALCIVIYAAFAARLGKWSITMPMVFVAVGYLLGPNGANLLPLAPAAEQVRVTTELTLALLLFADASTLSLNEARHDAQLPLRLLTIGLLLTIALGAVLAMLMFPSEGFAFACLLGAILAPTDAALGLPIFNNPSVPVRIRRALNIESGLNDGIATPFVLLFLALAASSESATPDAWLRTALVEIVLAIVAGTVTGLIGGWALTRAERHGWTNTAQEQIAILGMALAAYFGSLAIGGNGFIAAFVGGIVFSASSRDHFVEATEFTENTGTLLSLIVWMIFGAVLVGGVVGKSLDWRPVVYAILSLTVVRMAPVALALIGMKFRRDTVALMGWFGPRGLASVVFTLMALSEFSNAGRPIDTLVVTATWTILLSILAHGFSAVPLSSWYARRLAAAQGPLPELEGMPELPQRRSALTGAPAPQPASVPVKP